jgi:hypothetical protein
MEIISLFFRGSLDSYSWYSNIPANNKKTIHAEENFFSNIFLENIEKHKLKIINHLLYIIHLTKEVIPKL